MGTIRADRHGAILNGGGFFYAPKVKARWSSGLLSFCLSPKGESTSLCAQRGGGILAQTGLGLVEVHEGHGCLGEGKSGDREGVEKDRRAKV
jgi:hypothetical protein